MRDPFAMMYQQPEKCPKMARAAALTAKLHRMVKGRGLGSKIEAIYNEREIMAIRDTYHNALDLLLRAAGVEGTPQQQEDVPLAEVLLVQLLHTASQFPRSFLGSPGAIETEWMNKVNDCKDNRDDHQRDYYNKVSLIFQGRDRDQTGAFTPAANKAIKKLMEVYKPLLDEFNFRIYCCEFQCWLSNEERQSEKYKAIINAMLKYSSRLNVGPDKFFAWELYWTLQQPMESRGSSTPIFIAFDEAHMPMASLQPEPVIDAHRLIDKGFKMIDQMFDKDRDKEKSKAVWNTDINAVYNGIVLSARQAADPKIRLDKNAVLRYRKKLQKVTEVIFYDSLGEMCISSGYNEYQKKEMSVDDGQFFIGHVNEQMAPVKRYTKEQIMQLMI